MNDNWAETHGELDFTLTLDERKWLVELLRSTPRYKNLSDPGDRSEIESMCMQLLPECPICGQLEPHVCRETL